MVNSATCAFAARTAIVGLTIACGSLFAESPAVHRQLGFISELKAVPVTSHVTKRISYAPEELAQLKTSMQEYYQSDAFRESMRIATPFHHLNERDYFRELMSHREQSLAFNVGLLEEAESLLSSSKKRLLRKLVNQLFVKSGDVDGFVIMNELEIDFKTYEKLKKSIESHWKGVPPTDIEKSRATISFLAAQMDSEELDKAIGEEYDGRLVFTKRANPSANPKTFARLLLKPGIQVELQLSVDQATALGAVARPLLEADDEQYEEEKLFELLDESQQVRLRQLGLQSDLRSMNMNGVMRAMSKFGGEEVKIERGSKSPKNWIQAEAFYSHEFRSIKAGKAAFGEVLGEDMVTKLCGQFEHRKSRWRYINEELDDEALERAKKRVQKPKKKTVNPRRRTE